MGTPWDRAAEGYLEQWVPRFVPYHLDLVRELALAEGEHVLVASAGPGAEVLAVARAVGERGKVRATDRSGAMVRLCREQTSQAGLAARVEHAQVDASDTHGGPWDAVVCAFGLWQIQQGVDAVRAWGKALAPRGKVGIITWGPFEVGQPFEQLRSSLQAVEPASSIPAAHVRAERSAMQAMFEEAGLTMVRHTVVRHTMTFASAEAFVRAMRESCTWRSVWEDLGDERLARVAAHFYAKVGGPSASLAFDPPATLAVGALPGAEVTLAVRQSMRAPPV